MTRRFAFTGTRRKLTTYERAAIEGILQSAGLAQDWDEWHHGGAEGIDGLIDQLGKKWGHQVISHPADWDTHSKKAGPIRNRQMLDSAEFTKLWAFPSKEKSVGTLNCIKAALVRKIDLEVIWLS